MCAVTQSKKDDSQQLTSKIKKLHQHIGGCLEERLRFRADDFADVAWRSRRTIWSRESEKPGKGPARRTPAEP
jgi:hypothetical protein